MLVLPIRNRSSTLGEPQKIEVGDSSPAARSSDGGFDNPFHYANRDSSPLTKSTEGTITGANTTNSDGLKLTVKNTFVEVESPDLSATAYTEAIRGSQSCKARFDQGLEHFGFDLPDFANAVAKVDCDPVNQGVWSVGSAEVLLETVASLAGSHRSSRRPSEVASMAGSLRSSRRPSEDVLSVMSLKHGYLDLSTPERSPMSNFFRNGSQTCSARLETAVGFGFGCPVPEVDGDDDEQDQDSFAQESFHSQQGCKSSVSTTAPSHPSRGLAGSGGYPESQGTLSTELSSPWATRLKPTGRAGQEQHQAGSGTHYLQVPQPQKHTSLGHREGPSTGGYPSLHGQGSSYTAGPQHPQQPPGVLARPSSGSPGGSSLRTSHSHLMPNLPPPPPSSSSASAMAMAMATTCTSPSMPTAMPTAAAAVTSTMATVPTNMSMSLPLTTASERQPPHLSTPSPNSPPGSSYREARQNYLRPAIPPPPGCQARSSPPAGPPPPHQVSFSGQTGPPAPPSYAAPSSFEDQQRQRLTYNQNQYQPPPPPPPQYEPQQYSDYSREQHPHLQQQQQQQEQLFRRLPQQPPPQPLPQQPLQQHQQSFPPQQSPYEPYEQHQQPFDRQQQPPQHQPFENLRQRQQQQQQQQHHQLHQLHQQQGHQSFEQPALDRPLTSFKESRPPALQQQCFWDGPGATSCASSSRAAPPSALAPAMPPSNNPPSSSSSALPPHLLPPAESVPPPRDLLSHPSSPVTMMVTPPPGQNQPAGQYQQQHQQHKQHQQPRSGYSSPALSMPSSPSGNFSKLRQALPNKPPGAGRSSESQSGWREEVRSRDPMLDLADVEVRSRSRGTSRPGSPASPASPVSGSSKSKPLAAPAAEPKAPRGFCPSGATTSLGSTAHGELVDGQPKCQPCAWFYKETGCLNGAGCRYCHLCPYGELKNRKKQKIQRLRAQEAAEAAEAAAAEAEAEAEATKNEEATREGEGEEGEERLERLEREGGRAALPHLPDSGGDEFLVEPASV